MRPYQETARFADFPQERARVELDQKIEQSAQILANYCDNDVIHDLTAENFCLGIVPRVSPYDQVYLPEETRLVEIPHVLQERLAQERSYDLIRWNKPAAFLYRLEASKEPFREPIQGRSRVMDRLAADGIAVAFDDLKSMAPPPENGRQSRSQIDAKMEINIMGQARIPFALGSVPDVGSFISYVTMAQANGMVFISRDKLLSNIDRQSSLTKDVINYLKQCHLPQELKPNPEELEKFRQVLELRRTISEPALRERYNQALRHSWIANVGAAIEADTDRALARAGALYNAGCRLFRIYSPEGGTEIIDTAVALRKEFGNNIKIVGGQIMDAVTARRAEDAGCDALFIGVAGGSQCTTSVNADIPVNTPNLLYELRGSIKIPVGIEGGGVGTHVMSALVLGASFVSKPGEIGVSWEGSGGKYMFVDPDGNYFMIYGGEASVSAKWWKDSVDTIGRPKFVEGETGVRRIYEQMEQEDKRNISMTGNINRLRNLLSVGLVFQRVDRISELHRRTCDNIVQVTPAAAEKSSAYAS